MQWVYLPGWVATIRLTLRRTLIRSVILFGIVKQLRVPLSGEARVLLVQESVIYPANLSLG